MQTRALRLGSSNGYRMIVDPQIDDRTAADGILLRVRGMKPEFNVADIKPSESVFEAHAVIWTFQKIGPPVSYHRGLIHKEHHCSHDR